MHIQTSNALEYIYNALTKHEAIKKHGSAVMGYVSLFGITPFHIKALKFRRIMEEMVRLFDSKSFSYKKKTYSISHAGIVEALDICIKKNFDEVLENHNYLKKVMITIAEREEKSASAASEKNLRSGEELSRAGYSHPKKDYTDTDDLPPINLTQEQRKSNLARVGKIIESIGGNINGKQSNNSL